MATATAVETGSIPGAGAEESPGPPSRRARVLLYRPPLVDVLVAVGYVPVVVLYASPVLPDTNTIHWVDLRTALPVLAVVALALAFRRRAPFVALGVALAGELMLRTLDVLGEPFSIGIAVYEVARTRSRRATAAACVAVGLLLAASVVVSGRSPRGAAVVTVVVGVFLVLGLTQGELDRRVLADREHERTRQELALLERERARRTELARAVHDLVSGSLGVTLRLAQAARCARTDDARDEVLVRIEETCRSATRSTRELLALLRSEAVVPHAAVVEANGPSDLVGVARAAGVRCDVAGGVPAGASPEAAAVAWAVAREGVINVLKHARSATRVTVALTAPPGRLRVEVRDDGRPAPDGCPAPDGPAHPGRPSGPPTEALPGYGLRGLRERVAALGGTLVAGRDGGSWSLVAELPLSEDAP